VRAWIVDVRLACAGLLLFAAGALLAGGAAAHRLAPSLLEVREVSPGRVEVFWKTPTLRPTGVDLRPELPEVCAALTDPVPGGSAGWTGSAAAATLRWSADCGEAGLVGLRFRVHGLAESRTQALLRLELADGRRLLAVLRGGAPVFVVPEREQPLQVAGDYLGLGFRHILSGLDHLLFVLGLVLLVRSRRMLVWTVSAFTLGHSVTLSLAVLGFLGLPSRLVEILIAVSILVLAVELARGEDAPPSPLRRLPWAMAGLFGLLHGFGFAGALAEVGLPEAEIPLALLFFNLGIEVGQLVFVAAVLAAQWALRPLTAHAPPWFARVPAYGIGSFASWWCFERAAVFF
jgi:hydrogenase/urease accessory protein HupE